MGDGGVAPRPPVSEPVELEPEDGRDVWSSHVVGAAGDELVLAAPAGRPGVAVFMRPGVPLAVRWVADDGVRRLPGVVTAVERGAAAVWRVRPTGPSGRDQRRSFVRVVVALPLRLELPGGAVPATMVDLSEAGVRCLVAPRSGLGVGDRLVVAIRVEGHEVVGAAEVVRADASQGRRRLLALRFGEPNARDADVIRRFLFAEERRRRAAGLA